MFDEERFRAGDHDHFATVVDAHAPLVMQIARSFATDADHAEDLFQKSWTKIYFNAHTFAGRGTIAAWIHRVTTNVCLSDSQSRARKSEGLRLYAAQRPDSDRIHEAAEPLDQAHETERASALHEAMTELPNRQLATVMLRIIERRSASETAEIMGVSTATVRSNLRHAIIRLRTILEDPDE